MSAEAKTQVNLAAFFDLDGTLVPEPSLERRFFSELRRAGKLPFVNYFCWFAEALWQLPSGLAYAQHANKRYLRGISCELAFRHVESITFFEEGIARVAWHAREGHEIVIVSGTIEPLARLAAMALECELEVRNIPAQPKILATRLADEHGRWTGSLASEAMFGRAKAHAVEAFAKSEGIDLQESYAYGNSVLDGPLLSAVGHAHAVNPGRKLAGLANEKDWPIWHWFQERQVAAAESDVLASGIQQVEGQT